jgi:hypothetical protein
MPILRDRNGIFYDIPGRTLKKYAVPPTRVKQILKGQSVAGGPVGKPQGPVLGAPYGPSTIVINLTPPGLEPGACEATEAAEKGEVQAYSSSACWRRSCACWRRSCSCKK